MLTVQELLNILQKIAPDSLAEQWDNVGLLIGNRNDKVQGILLALDPVSDLIDQATALGVNVILTHHPVIFHALKTVHTDTAGGHFIAQALIHNLSVIGCHTNLDAAIGGVSDVLAEALGLTDTAPLVPADAGCPQKKGCGLGRIGSCTQALTPQAFLERLESALNPPWLLEAGVRPAAINTVAVCGGSCSDLAETALLLGADVLLTAEVKHSVACWARDKGFWIIDGGHFATENPGIQAVKRLLSQFFQQQSLSIPLHIASQQPPLRLVSEVCGSGGCAI